MSRRRDRYKEILKQANLDPEFGTLEYALAELQSAAPDMTTAVQNYVAEKVVERFQAKYNKYASNFVPSNPVERARGPLPYNEYFARDLWAYDEVINEPLDLSWGASAKNPRTGMTAAQMLPSAFRAKTVKGGMQWLGASEIPGVLQSIGAPVNSWVKNPNYNKNAPWSPENAERIPGPMVSRAVGDFPMDDFQAGWQRGYEGMYLYKAGEGNFTIQFNSNAQHGIRDRRRADTTWNKMNTPLSAFESGDEIDMYSGLNEGARTTGIDRYSMPSVAPELDLGNYITDIQKQNAGTDIPDYDTYDVQTGVYRRGKGSASSLRVVGVDPNSPAARGGMKEGALIPSLQRLFERNLGSYDYADAVENGQKVNLGVIQPDASGKLTEQVLNIQPGNMGGRGFAEGEKAPGNWVTDLAGRITHNEAQATSLWTTSDYFEKGMYQDESGNWKLSPLSRQKTGDFNVPVRLNRSTIDRFGKMYDQMGEVWKAHSQGYSDALGNAEKFVGDRNTILNQEGRFDLLDSGNYEMDVLKETVKNLPRGVSKPGSELFNNWTNAEAMMDELGDIERDMNAALPRTDSERTVEQFDTWASSQLRYTNPAIYNVGKKRRVSAEQEAINAKEYLARQNHLRDVGFEERASGWNETPGGYDARGRLPRRYPNLVGIQTGTKNKLELEGLVGWRETMREELPKKRKNWTRPARPSSTNPMDLPDSDNGTFIPGGSEARPDSLGTMLDNIEQETNRALRKDPTNWNLGVGRAAWNDTLEARERQRTGAPAPDFQGNPAPRQVTPSRPEGAHAEPGGTEGVPRDPGDTVVFPLGSMNEDDWTWELRGHSRPDQRGMLRAPSYGGKQSPDPKPRREEISARDVDDFNNPDAILGGDSSTEEYLNAPITRHVERQATKRYGFPDSMYNPRPYDVVYNRITHEPIVPTSTVYNIHTRKPMLATRPPFVGIGELAADPTRTLSSLDQNVVGGVLRSAGQQVSTLSAQDVNHPLLNRDPVIQGRMGTGSDIDTDLSEVSASADIGDAERRFGEAIMGIEDASAPGASLSAKVSSVGNKKGFFSNNWKEFFTAASKEDPSYYGTYWALQDADNQQAQAVDRLKGNLAKLFGEGRRGDALRVRFGEEPGSKSYDRGSLRMVSEQYNLDLPWQYGKEEALFDQISRIANPERPEYNPEGFEAVTALFAPQSEQLRVSELYRQQSRGHGRGPGRNTPSSARGTHSNLAPRGRSQAFMSDEEMGLGGPAFDPNTGEFNPASRENTPPPASMPDDTTTPWHEEIAAARRAEQTPEEAEAENFFTGRRSGVSNAGNSGAGNLRGATYSLATQRTRRSIRPPTRTGSSSGGSASIPPPAGNPTPPPAGNNGGGRRGNPPPPPPEEPPDDFFGQPDPLDPDNLPDDWDDRRVIDYRRAHPRTQPTPAAQNLAQGSQPLHRYERPQRRSDREVITDPVTYAHIKPQAGMLMESEDPRTGELRTLAAQKVGTGPNAQTQWMDMGVDANNQTTYTKAVNVPRFGTISQNGETIARVSAQEYEAFRGTERSQATPLENAGIAARSVPISVIQKGVGISGTPRPIGADQKAWEIARSKGDFSREWEVTQSSEDVGKAYSLAQSASSDAMAGRLPGNAVERIATIQKRTLDGVLDGVEKYIKDEIGKGVSPDVARVAGEKFKETATFYANEINKSVAESMSQDLGVSKSDVNRLKGNNIRLHSAEEVQALADRSPMARRKIQEMGLTPQEAFASGKFTAVVDEEGNAFDVGTQGKYGDGGGRGGNNIWGGKGNVAGMALYGMYMMGREWKMAMGGSMQTAEAYGEHVSALGQIALPEGTRAAQSAVGFTARQEIGKEYMGRGAYQTLAPFMDIPYLMSGYGEGFARLGTTTGMGVGVGGGMFMGGQMLAMMDNQKNPGALTAIGGFMGKAGIAAGLGIAVAGAGMEIYNAVKPEEWQDVTFGRLASTATKAGILTRAAVADQGLLTGASNAIVGMGIEAAKAAVENIPGETPKFVKNFLGIFNGAAPLQGIADNLTEQEKDILGSRGTPKEVEELLKVASGIQARTGEDQAQTVQAAAMQKRWLGEMDYDTLRKTADVAVRRGMATSSLETEAAQYASSMGYVAGTDEFASKFREYATEPDLTTSENMQFRSQRIGGLGGQLQATMGWDKEFNGLGARLVAKFQLQNQQQVGAFAGMVGGMQQTGAQFTPMQYEQMAAMTQANTPYAAGVIGDAMAGMMMGGMSQASAMQIGGTLSSYQMSNQDASIYSKMMQGDLGAYSYQAWQTGNMDNAFQDRAGRDISQHNGAVAMQVYNAWAQKPEVGLPGMNTAQFLGVKGTPSALQSQMMSAFEENGFYGVQKLAAQKSYEASMAMAGIQLKGIQLQENFNWGANAGGTWDNPTQGSAWGIEDRMLALQDRSARANFAEQGQRMNWSNQFGIQRENQQAERMQVGRAYQNWNWSANYNQFQQSQTWARQDWQYQDTTRQLGNAWQMEDLNEAIRFSSGRERKQLVRQRDRASLSQNLEEENIETQRDRQKELWAQQEERFQKEKQYMLENQRLDEESFELNKEQREVFYKMDVASYQRRMQEYDEEQKLQGELRELQRKFQYDQLQLSKEAAGVQAAAAAAQRTLNEGMATGQQNWEKLIGTILEINKYNNAFRVATATKEMMNSMDNVSIEKVNSMIELLNTIQNFKFPSLNDPRD